MENPYLNNFERKLIFRPNFSSNEFDIMSLNKHTCSSTEYKIVGNIILNTFNDVRTIIVYTEQNTSR